MGELNHRKTDLWGQSGRKIWINKDLLLGKLAGHITLPCPSITHRERLAGTQTGSCITRSSCPLEIGCLHKSKQTHVGTSSYTVCGSWRYGLLEPCCVLVREVAEPCKFWMLLCIGFKSCLKTSFRWGLLLSSPCSSQCTWLSTITREMVKSHNTIHHFEF